MGGGARTATGTGTKYAELLDNLNGTENTDGALCQSNDSWASKFQTEQARSATVQAQSAEHSVDSQATVILIKNSPNLYKEPTVSSWLKDNEEMISADNTSREHLIATSLKFVEAHFREKLGIKAGESVEIPLDTQDREGRSARLVTTAPQYSDFTNGRIKFDDLRLEIRGKTFLIISLWDVPQSAREHGSWPPVVSIGVDCPKNNYNFEISKDETRPRDGWAITSIGFYGVEQSIQKNVEAIFQQHHSLNTQFPVIEKKKK
jgi:hypothetical protein